MHATFVGRQPIFDRALDVFGYEILFRSGLENRASFVDGDAASSQVIVNTFTDSDLETILCGKLGFFNVTRGLLIDRIPLVLPPERVVIEVLEDVDVDEDVVGAVDELCARGYQIALDDYSANTAHSRLLDFADLVKLDIQAVRPADLAHLVASLRMRDVKLVAEKVETGDELRLCRNLGFDYFQGYFLSRPEVVERRMSTRGLLHTKGLVASLREPGISIEELADVVGRNSALSHALVRMASSAHVPVPRVVGSVLEAVLCLGTVRIARWASLLELAGVDPTPAQP